MNDNKWYHKSQRVTTNDNEWQQVVQRVTTSENKSQRMAASDNLQTRKKTARKVTKNWKWSFLNLTTENLQYQHWP